jgi:glyoxylate reductase
MPEKANAENTPIKVVVSQRIFPEALKLLSQAGLTVDLNDAATPLAKAALAARLRDADGLICLLTDQIDAELLAQAPKLKIVANVAVGYNNIDVAAATERGIMVSNTPDVLTEATADLAFALLLAAARRLTEADRYVREGRFAGWELFQPHLGLSVWGKTLGLIGMGRIGQAVARRAKGFNMRVCYHNRSRVAAALERELGAEFVSFEALLVQSDFISIHAPLTDDTHHLIDAAALAMMKPSAILINTARGPIVDEAALAAALASGQLAGAGLDVFEREPEVHAALLKQHQHVVLAPHIGSATYDTRRDMSVLAARNVVRALGGNKPPSLVNPETWRAAS